MVFAQRYDIHRLITPDADVTIAASTVTDDTSKMLIHYG